MTSTVNDLMAYLNTKLGLNLPVMPLPTWMAGLKALWQAVATNWSSGSPVPTEVTVDILDGTTITLAGAELPVTKASVKLSKPVSKS